MGHLWGWFQSQLSYNEHPKTHAPQVSHNFHWYPVESIDECISHTKLVLSQYKFKVLVNNVYVFNFFFFFKSLKKLIFLMISSWMYDILWLFKIWSIILTDRVWAFKPVLQWQLNDISYKWGTFFNTRILPGASWSCYSSPRPVTPCPPGNRCRPFPPHSGPRLSADPTSSWSPDQTQNPKP